MMPNHPMTIPPYTQSLRSSQNCGGGAEDHQGGRGGGGGDRQSPGEVEPVDEVVVPGGHASHASWLPASYVPMAQVRQVSSPPALLCEGWNVPARQL